MRKIKYILIVLSGVLTITSCDTGELELTNPNTLSPETFFKTEAQVQSSVNASYAGLQTRGLYGRNFSFAMDLMAHDALGNPQLEGNKKPFQDFSFNGGNDIIQYYWEACYIGISRANFVLDNEAKINALANSVLSQEKKNKYLGEAHFLRAYYYFLLVKRFGDLPIYKTGTIVGKGRSPKAEVYALIEEDLVFATKNLLPRTTESAGRANKEAAFAYLGKVLLYEKKYDEALVAFNGVTGFSLEDKGSFYNNFMAETEHGKESIFEIEFDEKNGTGDQWGAAGDSQGTGFEESTLRGQEYGNLSWYNVYPSDDLLDSYEVGDDRFGDTFYVPGSTYLKGTKVMVASNFTTSAGIRRAGWKKYQNYYIREDEATRSSINFKVMRYADVLLMKAECENQRAGGSQTTAIAYIKEVRDRANLATNITATKDAVFTAIVHERKVEFAGEQSRFDDVIRWGIAATELAGTGFQTGKSELWPIPNRETSSNPNIKPSDNNPGY
ncbi:putative outer membrane starch-binding protein [Flavobacterium sp. 90]|uniref:RagB/SusD family nutrient uptake outer membrane protein n=1 Tax=unclassified Flavobacterium TaxID=196869 RepID=UPI000EB582BF|nr:MULTISPECIES: RagB/SusD family nutrient uptake outer membrane protein [unclassified Flavobacterium]RKR09029.1 putative outer membrane starch-binding protein [Flavobacterium sp. 81]TCK52816.1 putative outer membrane starch-binding protein [Flavobacterium sp. 90]